RVDAVGLLAGGGLGEHALRVFPQAVCLEAILELDAEGASKHGQIVLDADRALAFEAAEQPLAAVVNRGQDLGAPASRPFDLVEDQRLPRLRAELRLYLRRAETAEARLGLDLDEGE